MAAIVTMLNQKGGVGQNQRPATTWPARWPSDGPARAPGRQRPAGEPRLRASGARWPPRTWTRRRRSRRLYAGDTPFPEQVIRPTGISGIDLIPGSRARRRSSTRHSPSELRTATFQAVLRRRSSTRSAIGYDIVLIDCPPEPASLFAGPPWWPATHLIVPLQAGGLRRPGPRAGPGIGRHGDRRAESRSCSSGFPHHDVQRTHWPFTSSTTACCANHVRPGRLRIAIPYAVDYKEAIARRLPIAQYKPQERRAKAIKALADELFARLTDSPGITNTQEAA